MFFPKSLQGLRERERETANIPPFFLFLYLDHSMVIQKAICEQLDEEESGGYRDPLHGISLGRNMPICNYTDIR